MTASPAITPLPEILEVGDDGPSYDRGDAIKATRLLIEAAKLLYPWSEENCMQHDDLAAQVADFLGGHLWHRIASALISEALRPEI